MIVAGTKGWTCKTCQREVQTYRLVCAQCGQERYPTLSAKPAWYVCQFCLAGAGMASRKAALAAKRGPRGKFASKA